ncbi:hypothetical protein [Pseudooceanicola nitratireducens]|uniref:hypothetical protein n=1 Tax=Pseudooceanicola nitratireducens TaxID=517719 RepID=UPI001C94E8B0|nr:hypothetical protein [Pseudooceanicola nitratireducens]MBY6157476.1 hypothetical protein [Pseudooceanicola nitratireducens]
MTDLTRLKTNYETMVNIVRSREDGRRFIDIVVRLEEEIRKIENQSSAYDRIMRA